MPVCNPETGRIGDDDMRYADYEYYVSEYLSGQPPTVPGESFAFWEKRAAGEIDCRTFNRLRNKNVVPEEVKECTCAITELLYKANSVSEMALKDGITGVLTSYSNDGESGSYDVSQSIYTESGKKAEIRRLITLYLGNTGLLYAGVGCCEP